METLIGSSNNIFYSFKNQDMKRPMFMYLGMLHLQVNLDRKLVLDSSFNDHLIPIEKQEWKEFYPFAEKSNPPDMPGPLGIPIELVMFVAPT